MQVPSIPGSLSLVSRMLWLTVSKAALRSRRMRMLREPVSAEVRRSFRTLRRAVSVLWRGRKPDWRGSNWLLA